MKSLTIIFILFIVLIGCENSDEYVYFDDPPLQETSDQTRTLLRDDLQVDVLFVVDNSGSMGSIQENIVKNAALFMEAFTQNNIMDWRMGLMSTDKSDAPYLGFNSIFDKSTTNPVAKFQSAVNSLGTNGDPSEYVFYNVLRPMQNPNLQHFFREGAHLAVIMVTDEKEQSETKFGSQYEPITLINAIKSFKRPNRVIRFYGAFNFLDLEGCQGSWSGSYKGSPFEKIIDETSGMHMSACTEDFGIKLAEIGKDIIKLGEAPKFTLNTRPKIETIKVYYDGVILPMGKEEEGGIWYYDKYFNTINFYNIDFAPDFEDSKIRITYDIDDGVDRSEEEI